MGTPRAAARHACTACAPCRPPLARLSARACTGNASQSPGPACSLHPLCSCECSRTGSACLGGPGVHQGLGPHSRGLGRPSAHSAVSGPGSRRDASVCGGAIAHPTEQWGQEAGEATRHTDGVTTAGGEIEQLQVALWRGGRAGPQELLNRGSGAGCGVGQLTLPGLADSAELARTCWCRACAYCLHRHNRACLPSIACLASISSSQPHLHDVEVICIVVVLEGLAVQAQRNSKGIQRCCPYLGKRGPVANQPGRGGAGRGGKANRVGTHAEEGGKVSGR